MKANVRRASALIAMVGLLVVPILPPEHIHRGPLGVRHNHTLIHRHFAPHTTSNGTHLEHPGVQEGPPLWLADPAGSLTHTLSLTADNTLLLFHVLLPPSGMGEYVVAQPDTSIHAPPRLPFSLRAPPLQL
jgi:hypothetical protein